MKKTKKKSEPTAKVMTMKCTTCGRETPHYVNAKGEVRCAICQTVAKKVEVKTPKEVIFEMDVKLDEALNPKVSEPEIIVPEAETKAGSDFDVDAKVDFNDELAEL